eukprot:jgi/Botrbrau1/8678/Bobra.0087s0031.1
MLRIFTGFNIMLNRTALNIGRRVINIADLVLQVWVTNLCFYQNKASWPVHVHADANPTTTNGNCKYKASTEHPVNNLNFYCLRTVFVQVITHVLHDNPCIITCYIILYIVIVTACCLTPLSTEARGCSGLQ